MSNENAALPICLAAVTWIVGQVVSSGRVIMSGHDWEIVSSDPSTKVEIFCSFLFQLKFFLTAVHYSHLSFIFHLFNTSTGSKHWSSRWTVGIRTGRVSLPPNCATILDQLSFNFSTQKYIIRSLQLNGKIMNSELLVGDPS